MNLKINEKNEGAIKVAQTIVENLEGLLVDAKKMVSTLNEIKKEETKLKNPRYLIIEEAKAFIEKYRSVRTGESSHSVGNKTAKQHFYEVEFTKKGNNTTALIYHLDLGVKRQSNIPNRVGKSVLHKDDTYNKYIGEAIALGRALDINVDKFIKADNPTDYVVGQVVRGGELNGYYKPSKTFTLTCKDNSVKESFFYKENPSDFIFTYQIGKILDDTNADYENGL